MNGHLNCGGAAWVISPLPRKQEGIANFSYILNRNFRHLATHLSEGIDIFANEGGEQKLNFLRR